MKQLLNSNQETKRVRNIDQLSLSKNKNFTLITQKRMLSITKNKGKVNNEAFNAIKHHKVYTLAEDEKYLYVAVRTHNISDYDPKFKGETIAISLEDEVLGLRSARSWMFGKYNEIENPTSLPIFTEADGRKEYIIASVVIALTKENLKDSISLENVSEIDSMDKAKKISIEDYKSKINEVKEFILYNQEGKMKSEQLVYFVNERKHEVINTKEWSTKINMLEIEKQNNLFYNKEKDCYEDITLSNKDNISIE